MNSRNIKLMVSVLCLSTFMSCGSGEPKEGEQNAMEAPIVLVDQPSQIKWLNEKFEINDATVIYADEKVMDMGQQLINIVAYYGGKQLPLQKHDGGEPKENSILLNIIEPNGDLDAFAINVNKSYVWITVSSFQGCQASINFMDDLLKKSAELEASTIQGVLLESH